MKLFLKNKLNQVMFFFLNKINVAQNQQQLLNAQKKQKKLEKKFKTEIKVKKKKQKIQKIQERKEQKAKKATKKTTQKQLEKKLKNFKNKLINNLNLKSRFKSIVNQIQLTFNNAKSKMRL